MSLLTGGSGGGGGTTLLSDTTLGANGTFDVSSISQAYTDLLLIALLRGMDAGSTDSARIKFNNDSGANYGSQTLEGSNSTPGSNPLAASTFAWLSRTLPAQGLAANNWLPVSCWIPFYTVTTAQKIFFTQPLIGFTTAAAGAIVSVQIGLWTGTAAVNRVQITGGLTANLQAGSRLRIYGTP